MLGVTGNHWFPLSGEERHCLPPCLPVTLLPCSRIVWDNSLGQWSPTGLWHCRAPRSHKNGTLSTQTFHYLNSSPLLEQALQMSTCSTPSRNTPLNEELSNSVCNCKGCFPPGVSNCSVSVQSFPSILPLQYREKKRRKSVCRNVLICLSLQLVSLLLHHVFERSSMLASVLCTLSVLGASNWVRPVS